MVTFYAFVRDALLAMSGADAAAAADAARRAARRRSARSPAAPSTSAASSRAAPTAAGRCSITGSQGSGILRSMSEANGLVVLHHEQGNVAAGDAGRRAAVRRAGLRTTMYPTPSQASGDTPRKPMTLHRLRAMHAAGEKIAMLTCYDASFARAARRRRCRRAAGRRLAGHGAAGPRQHAAGDARRDGLPHACVARGNRSAWIVADLPFGSYHDGPTQALRSAAVLMQARRADGQARRRRLDAPRRCASWSSAASRSAPTSA